MRCFLEWTVALGSSGIAVQATLLFISAMLLSLFLTPIASRFALRVGAVDLPDGRKLHEKAVPRLGGLAILAAVIATLLGFGIPLPGIAPFLGGFLLVAVTGFADDVSRLKPAVKFAGQVLAAALFVWASGESLRNLGDFAGIGTIRTGWFAPILTVFCMVGIMNALNLSDGLDGLAGGISVIACVTLGIFAYLLGDWTSLAILVALSGGVIGFLRYNSYPATLFMGDTGSLTLGFCLSAVAVRLSQRTGAEVSPVTLAAVLALPAFDTLFVMLCRLVRRQNPFLPDKTHLHHRLMELGLSHAEVVSTLYAAMAGFGFLAWTVRDWEEWRQTAAVLLAGAVVYGLVFLCQYARVRFHVTGESRPPGGRGNDRTMPRLSGWTTKSMSAVSLFIVAGLCVPVVAAAAVPWEAGGVAFASVCFVGLLFPWRTTRSQTAICSGLMYVACFSLFGILNILSKGTPWIRVYLAAYSGVILVWVFLKMQAWTPHKVVMRATGFETLLIGVSLFVPFVGIPATGLGEGARNAILAACIESIPLLMALKILVRKRDKRNDLLVATLLLPLLLVGMRGLWFPEVSASFPRTPVHTQTARSAVLSPPPTEEKPRICPSLFYPGTTGRTRHPFPAISSSTIRTSFREVRVVSSE
jgi:UDP-GlcNAc:undecaprenyl-phosphate GlcNAc-1-phosphate transferase